MAGLSTIPRGLRQVRLAGQENFRPTEAVPEVRRSRRLDFQGRQLMRPTPALRQFCLDCLGATTAGGAFDCLSRMCPLVHATPFRGKPMPVSKAPSCGCTARGDVTAEQACPECHDEVTRMRENAGKPRVRVTAKTLTAFCRRECQVEDRRDCGAFDCAFYPYQPWSSRKRRKRRAGGRPFGRQGETPRVMVPVDA